VNGFQPQELANKISDARKGSILFATSRSLVHISLLSPCSPRLFCPYHRGEGEMLEAFMEVVVRFVMLPWQNALREQRRWPVLSISVLLVTLASKNIASFGASTQSKRRGNGFVTNVELC